ncbi:MAG TPA: hypothetical protein VFU36_07670 [Jatrophihabitans sp.]|nr:hypothetical protein [Jatrophihabitans sp.]
MSDHRTRADILDAYQRLPIRPEAAAVRLPNDVIGCGDESLLETALALGSDLGRPVVTVAVTDGWLATEARPSSVLLLACRRGFTAELARTWVASALRHEIPLGFLLVDDPAEAEFQAAKIRLAHTRILPGEDAVVDAVNGFCGKAGEPEVARPKRLSAVLASSWRLLALGGHSDLGHLGLGSQLVCGATGPERFAGRHLADGCDPAKDQCRCTTIFLRTAVPAVSLRAAAVALMGCSTFDPTTTECSSTNSLCASILSGQPVAVIGVLGDLDSRFDAVGELARCLADGLSLGDAVQRLNRAHRIPTGYGIALAGDPALPLAPRRQPPADGRQTYVATDCRDRAQPLLDRCRQAISGARAADRIRRALLQVSDRSLEPGLEEALETLDRACEQVQDAAWTAVELLHEGVEYQRWQEPDRVMERLEKAIRRWDEAFLEAGGFVTGNDLYSALHAFHRLDGVAAEGSCPRCGSALSVFRYRDPELAERQRVATKCWQCGPMRESALTGPDLAIAVSGVYEPGAPLQPRLSVRALPEGRHGSGRLAVTLQDRLDEQVLSVHQAECSLAELPEISLTIPADARSDLHILWAVWVSELTVAFTATRVPVTRVVQ